MNKAKGYCLYCKSANERNHIFMVDTDQKECYCPSCGAKMSPKKAAKVYEDILTSHTNDALFKIRIVKNYHEAYEMYGDILIFDKDCVTARIGRLLSLFLLSTLRTSHIKDVLSLLKEEAPTYYHAKEVEDKYLFALLTLFGFILEYKNTMYKRLTIHDHFYEYECVKLYFERMNELISLEEFIASELKKYFPNNETDASRIKNRLAHDEEEILKPVTTIGGLSFQFLGFSNGQIIISELEGKKQVVLSKLQPMSLSSDKGKITIPDRIFKDGVARQKIFHALLPAGISILVLSAVVSSAAVIIEQFTSLFVLGRMMLAAGIILAILSLLLVFQYLFAIFVIKRIRRHLS